MFRVEEISTAFLTVTGPLIPLAKQGNNRLLFLNVDFHSELFSTESCWHKCFVSYDFVHQNSDFTSAHTIMRHTGECKLPIRETVTARVS